jgi:hypothetical protein
MRTLLIIGECCEDFEQDVEPTELYEFLRQYFDVEITYYTNCLQFKDTDLFVYF